MLANREMKLRFDDYISKAIPNNNRIGQGDPLSMGLYQFYNADLLDIPSNPNQLAIAYVDDVILYASGNTFEEMHKTLEDMMKKENGAINWSKDHNSPLEYSKLALIDFSHQNHRVPRPNLSLPHGTVEPKRSVKYLGVILDQHLGWAPQRAYTIEKGTKWASQIRRLARPGWGITPKYTRKLYIGTALPKVLYGVDIWYTPTLAKLWNKDARPKGTVKVTAKLVSMQRAEALAVTGGLQTSPTNSLDALAYLTPFTLLIEKWCYRAALRLAALPAVHPLQKFVTRSANCMVKKHRSPLHNLLCILPTNPRNIGTKAIATHNPEKQKKRPFNVSIHPNKESSKKKAQTATEEVQVFTDGSIIEDQVGAAAILTRPGKSHRTLHYHLGKLNEYTIYDAELAGLSLGMHLIKTENAARCRTMLGADNQAAINAVQNELSTPTHFLAEDTLHSARQIRKQRGNKNYSLTIRWTAGHVGIDGNELVDTEAKTAAKGQSLNPSSLPRILRRKLKASTAAMKQSHNKRVKKRWKKDWVSSARGKCDHQIDSSSPSKRFIEAISNPKLPRQTASLITQLRINHAPLNNYLYKFKRVDNPRCPACGESEEMVEHYLLGCPAYAHELWALEKAIKHKPDLKTLLGDHKAMLALNNYIKATHRFETPNSNQVSKSHLNLTYYARNHTG
jgi:ribonuclease HI